MTNLDIPVALALIVPIVTGVLVVRSNSGLQSGVRDARDTSATTVRQLTGLAVAVEQLQRDVAAITAATNGELNDRIHDAVIRALAATSEAEPPPALSPEQPPARDWVTTQYVRDFRPPARPTHHPAGRRWRHARPRQPARRVRALQHG